MNAEDSKNKEKLDNSLKIIAKTSVIVLIGLFVSKILSYAYRIIIARYYGPEEYGLFSLAILIFNLILVFCSLGLIDGLLRYFAIYRGKQQFDKIRYILKKSIIILSISSIISAAVLFLLSDWISNSIFHNSNLVIYLKVLSLILPINILGNIFLYTLRAYEKINLYSFISNILSNVLRVFFILIFLFIGFKSTAILQSYSLSILLTSIVSYLFCRYTLPDIFLEPVKKTNYKIFRSVLAFSWPLALMSIIGNLFYWIDSFALGYLKSSLEVGYYNSAVPLAALFAMSLEIFMQVFYPMITREYSNKNFLLIKELAKQVGKWVFIINLPLMFILLIFPGAIINILFGKTYLVAESSLRILAFGSFFLSLSSISGNLLSMLGKSKTILVNMLSFSAFNLILNFILIPAYGLVGAAIATSLSNILLGITCMIQVYVLIKVVPLRRKMLRIFIVSLVPLGILLFLRHLFNSDNLIIIVLIGLIFIISYVFMLFLAKCFDDNDKKILESVFRKLSFLKFFEFF